MRENRDIWRKNMKEYLLFDLDGTLTDPKVGICTCVQYALKAFGIEEPDIDKLKPFIGPPLKDSFMQFYDMSSEQVEAAVEKYRERFRDVGIFENKVYDGVPGMLEALQAKGMSLAVASSKPEVFVERILDHFGIRKYFKAVVGSELDGRRSGKDEVVEEALRRLFGDKPIEKDRIYMIGDRKFDAEGARAHGIESVGVTYGYGNMEELKEAKADYIVQSVEELQRFLLRGTQDPPVGLSLRTIGQFGVPFLLFLLVRSMVLVLAMSVFQAMGGQAAGVQLLRYDANGEFTGFTENVSAIVQMLGFAAAAAVVWGSARRQIRLAAEEDRLLHLKAEPVRNYIFLGTAVLGALFGGNLLLELTGLIARSSSYQAVSTSQHSVNPWLGLVLYVLISPLAEELLFRGIIYNSLKRCIQPALAALGAAAFFGAYHGNVVQGVYGFLMGCLIIYGYEYFGDFKVPVVMHAFVNLISLSLGKASFAVSRFVCWPVCILFLALCAGSLFLLGKQKRVFRAATFCK